MKKLSNVKLIGILFALGLIYFVVDFTGGKKKSKSLRTELVVLDSAKISKIEITATGKKVNLVKNGEDWELTLANGKKVMASSDAIDNAIFALNSIKPARMATRSESKWKDYQVDSAGTRVKVYEGGDKTLDLVIGRFAMEGQRSYYTFVRLFEDEEVYVAKDFMGFSVSSETSSYRDQVMARIKKDSVMAVTFNYPADSSVRLERAGDIWNVNGQQADSSAVASYLTGLNYVSGKEFMDNQEDLISPTISAVFDLSNGKTIIFDGYQNNGQWVFHSTINEVGYFTDIAIKEKVFKGLSSFL